MRVPDALLAAAACARGGCRDRRCQWGGRVSPSDPERRGPSGSVEVSAVNGRMFALLRTDFTRLLRVFVSLKTCRSRCFGGADVAAQIRREAQRKVFMAAESRDSIFNN